MTNLERAFIYVGISIAIDLVADQGPLVTGVRFLAALAYGVACGFAILDAIKATLIDDSTYQVAEEPTPDKPAAPDRSAASQVVGTAPEPDSSGPAPSQTRSQGHYQKIPDADRDEIKRQFLAFTSNGGKPPRGWLTAQAKKHGVTDSTIHFLLQPLRKPVRESVAPSEPEPEPERAALARKRALTHRDLTAAELSELERRCNIVTKNRTLSIPYDWARERGQELGVPATAIFAALTKGNAQPKERDPIKALTPPVPRVRRVHGGNYGGAGE